MVGLNSSENQISLGKNNTKTLRVPPIDLQYVLGKGQSESVAKTDLDDTSVDFIYSYFLQISGYSHRALSGPYSPTYSRCLWKFLALFSWENFGTKAHPILILTRIICVLKARIKTVHCHVCKL